MTAKGFTFIKSETNNIIGSLTNYDLKNKKIMLMPFSDTSYQRILN